MTTLHNYLARIEAIIYSRQEITVQDLCFEPVSTTGAYIEDRLIFYDGSFLEIEEVLCLSDRRMEKVRYSYHYQKGNCLIFRYDNAPHHPELPTFPHHKHVGDCVEPCREPDLHDVLREIDARLYSQRTEN
jgi:hypothetical protein